MFHLKKTLFLGLKSLAQTKKLFKLKDFSYVRVCSIPFQIFSLQEYSYSKKILIFFKVVSTPRKLNLQLYYFNSNFKIKIEDFTNIDKFLCMQFQFNFFLISQGKSNSREIKIYTYTMLINSITNIYSIYNCIQFKRFHTIQSKIHTPLIFFLLGLFQKKIVSPC